MSCYDYRAILSLIFVITSFTVANGQTHLEPPIGALRSHDMDAWDEITCRVSSSAGDPRIFVYTLKRERIERTPDWLDDELDPKLSPGVALRFAKRKFETLKPFGDSSYRFELHMQQYWNKWLWAVIFFPTDASGRPNVERKFPVFVLMDGGTLQPEVWVRGKLQDSTPK